MEETETKQRDIAGTAAPDTGTATGAGGRTDTEEKSGTIGKIVTERGSGPAGRGSTAATGNAAGADGDTLAIGLIPDQHNNAQWECVLTGLFYYE